MVAMRCCSALILSTSDGRNVEVVGPGFDASDLLRSDSLPHERFEVFLPEFLRPFREPVLAQRTHVIGTEDYKRTVEERLAKVGARLRNPAYPRTVIDSAGVLRARLADEGVQYLKRTKQTALLSRVDAYEPIPKRFLEKFVNGVGSIVDGLRRHNIPLGPTSFAGTFTERGRFVFWDFFPADLTKAKELYLNS